MTRRLRANHRRTCMFCPRRAFTITVFALWDLYRCERCQCRADRLRAEREAMA